MKIEYLLLITASGFFHAFYNFLMRRENGSRLFLTGIFGVGALLSLVATFLSGVPVSIPWNAVPYVFAASLFYTFYQVFISNGFERGDIAIVYPLAMLSPLFIPILALVFLKEIIPFSVWVGIFITLGGAILIQLRSLSFSEIKKMIFLGKDYGIARLALAASFMYAIGSVFDKSRISVFNIFIYMNFILLFMAGMLLVYVFVFERKQSMNVYIAKHYKPILIGGAVLFLSFLSFRMALQFVYVSIAVPVRLSSIVFAVLFGVLVLREKVNRKQVTGIIMLIIGILIIHWFRMS
ncbi:MAG: EamA family transporter [Bacteroidales bacterium]|nr:EamA family transporter [Bacteroidales bacterium]